MIYWFIWSVLDAPLLVLWSNWLGHVTFNHVTVGSTPPRTKLRSSSVGRAVVCKKDILYSIQQQLKHNRDNWSQVRILPSYLKFSLHILNYSNSLPTVICYVDERGELKQKWALWEMLVVATWTHILSIKIDSVLNIPANKTLRFDSSFPA